MTDRERTEYIGRRAQELATSGNYMGWLDIEWALRDEGYAEAHRQLDRRGTRHFLDLLCAISRKTKNAA